MKKSEFSQKFHRYKFFYIMLLPIAVYFLIFNYYPLILGIQKSFYDVKLLGGGDFVGLGNYQTVLNSPFYKEAFVNTLVVNFSTFILQFAWGLILALLLNEVRKKVLKSAIQSVTYLPNMLSWSVVGGIWIAVLAPTGMINGFLSLIFGEDFRAITFMAETALARPIFIFTGAWKGAGYTSVLFLAAIVGIDPSIYEAAQIDGASRMQQLFKITVPNLVPTMKTVTVLSMMGIMRNFDQIYVMRNSTIDFKVRNLLYLIFDEGTAKFKVGPATAAATIVLIITLIISFITRKLTRYDQTYD